MKLFNRFRKNVIAGSGLKKYLLYAVGEIILVVFGILIALGINQASEEGDKRKEMYRIAELVQSQMKDDEKNIEKTLKELDLLEKMIDTVLYKTPQNKSIDANCASCFQVLLGSPVPNTSVRVPNLIRQNPLVKGKIEKQLHKIELLYNDALQQQELYDQVVYDQLTENINHWKNNYDWFAGYLSRGSCEGDCLDYFQNSPDYRNRVAYFEFTIVIAYYAELDIFRKQIMKEREVLEALL
ncbi:hypothetical protein [uncultured Dokdonia sp.]|uniref:hypothetical protein n=1 Tax=uncultured Dokdonia sp. TaxID=575653 RepID=UPI0026148D42|nr:hypothetical protein [uncultured Dokdonia sp.]